MNHNNSTEILPKDNYSGVKVDGLNMCASYDRVYYSDSLASEGELLLAWKKCLETFEKSSKTRLVFNVVIPNGILEDLKSSDIPHIKQFAPGKIEALFRYPAATNLSGKTNLILGYNKPIRDLREKHLDCVRNKIKETMEKNSFDLNMQLSKIQDLVKDGYKFTRHLNSKELFELWKDTFGWTEQSVQEELSKDNGSIMGLLNEEKQLVTCGLISQGESTERATKLDQQGRGKGTIQQLILVLNAYNIYNDMKKDNSITPISAECRYDRAIKTGFLTGMELPPDMGENIGVHQNHVTVGGSEPDQWNIGKGIHNNIDFSQLRCFGSVHLKESMYDEKVVKKILETAKVSLD